ncbi:MAG TPA: STAS domain-containing protein [Lacunisphaera sp.]|nr:STAS domain-containing protein [Lacunisphaera sp.]
MKITSQDDTLRVSDLRELDERTAGELIPELRAALRPEHSTIEFDLTLLRACETETVDALLSIYDEFDREGASFGWRLLNPPSELRQLFELVRLHHFFEITPPRPPRMILL